MVIKPPPGAPAMYYMRKSNPKQSEFSTTGQEDLCCKLIAQEGYADLGGRADEAKTGRTLFNRPGLRDLRQLVAEGKVKVLVAETLDRFSRNMADLHRLFEDLCRMNCVIITAQEGLIDEMRMTLLALKASQDVKQTQERVKRGQSEVLKDGRVCGSVTYGHRKVKTEDGQNGLREKHPQHAPIVLGILEDFADGVSALKICERLNGQGIKAPRGGKWRPAVLLGSEQYGSGILRNRMYIGEFVFRRTHRELIPATGDTITKPGRKADQKVIPLPELRIASDELWEAVQARLAAGRAKANQPLGERRRATYVFSGKIVCGCCGQKMVVLGKAVGCDGRANIRNGCLNNVRVPRPQIEAAVFQGIREHLLQPEVLKPYLAEYAEAEKKLQESKAGETKRLEAQLAETEKTISNLIAFAAASQRSSKTYERLNAEMDLLEQTRIRQEQALATANLTRPPPPTRPEDVIAGVDRLLDQLGEAIEGDEPESVRARELLRELIGEIVITPLATETKQRRGSEPVQMTISGTMDDLFQISQTTLGRVSLSGFRTETRQGHASRTFRFEVVLNRRQSKLSQTAIDSKLIERLLDEANVPLTNAVLVEALLDGAHPDPEARRAVEARVRNALSLLQKAKRVRSIRLGRPVGWVWNHRPLTDDEWREATSKAVSVEQDVIDAGAVGITTSPPAVSLH